MSDVARWKVHGPVEALRTEFATWDLNQDDWQPVEHFTFNLLPCRRDSQHQ